MIFRKADREKLWDVGIDAHNCNCSLKTVMAQLKSLSDDTHGLYETLHRVRDHLDRLSGFVGSNQAVLDTLNQRVCDAELSIRVSLTALERKIDQRWADTMRVLEALHSSSAPRANGKRKR